MIMKAAATNPDIVSGLDSVIDPASTPECILSGFQFLEGPVWDHDERSLIFSDITGNAMYRWRENGGLVDFRRPSRMANGNAMDRQGRLLSCEHATSRVSRSDRNGNYEVLISHYLGLELNSPNDIVVRRDGTIYFTDPNSGRNPQYGVARVQELDFQGVFRFDPVASELTLLIDDFEKPNGLCFSHDESRLFINDTVRQHIRVFEVRSDGRIENGQVWGETRGREPGVADGMKLDAAGNLYCCGSGGIHVFDAGSTLLGIIRFPEVAVNFTWGGADLTDLYVTATHSVYRLHMRLPGHDPLAPSPQQDG
jgi:gluconolactonase